MNIQQPTIVGGSSTNNTMTYSNDGIYYKSLGNGIFSSSCNTVVWNGNLWVAGGSGTNTLAYSYDGLKWYGLGATVFTSVCYSLAWNNYVFVACGAGGNTLATSPDGLSWVGQGATVFDISGLSVDWNGYVWMVVGSGSTNTMGISSSTNGTGWNGMGKTVFTTQGNSIKWMVNKWVAAGSGGATLAYSLNLLATVWSSSPSTVFSSSGNALYWNGSIVVAGGTGTGNTIATSSDGINWSGKGVTTFSTACYGVYWNTKRWIAVGTGTNSIAYSYDGTTWYSAINNSLLTIGYSVGTNSKIGVSIVSSGLYLNKNDVLVVNTPRHYDDSLSSDTAISINMALPYAAADPVPDAPTNLQATSATTTSISVSFNSPSGPITYFTLNAIPTTGGTSVTQLFGSPAIVYTINGLNTSTAYSIVLTATNSFGQSNPSNTLITGTLPLGPTNLIQTSSTTNSITVSFTQSISENISSYTLMATPTAGDIKTQSINGYLWTGTISELSPATAYTLSLVAVSSVGLISSAATANGFTV